MNEEMSQLLKILPPTLKTNLAKYLYRDAITMTRLLQDREDNFYSKYLDQLQVKNFFQDDIVASKNRKEENVYFIVGGVVENYDTGRFYESGHMINHDCIFQNQPQYHNYRGFAQVTLTFKYTRDIYLEILENYPEIRAEIKEMVDDREKNKEMQLYVK